MSCVAAQICNLAGGDERGVRGGQSAVSAVPPAGAAIPTQTYSDLLGLTQTYSDLLRLTRTVTSQLLLKIVLFGLPWGYGLPLVYPVALVFHLIAR